MRLLPLACEAAASATFSACDCHLMRLRSTVHGKPTCGRRLMRLSLTRDRPSAQPVVGNVADAADLCAHVDQCSAAVDRSDQNVYSRYCLFIGESRGSR
ncbi:hypothetical protein BHM03_00049322, partial [Ensete ventricosum]